MNTTPARYRKRPVVIDAVLWEGTNTTNVVDWVLSGGGTARWHDREYVDGRDGAVDVARVQPHQLACRADWYRLPEPLRDKINAAWKRRTTHGGREHRSAVGEALAWYRANPRSSTSSR